LNPSSYYLKPGRRPASRKLGLGPNPRPTARFPLLTQRSSHALQVLDERPGGAAATRCAAGVRLRRSTPRFHTLATTHGSAPALGCACRPDPCSRASARGGRRVGPVAGHDAAAAGVSRRDGTPICSHDLLKSRVEARITSRPARPAQTLGQQQSGATAETGTHRRDARSAPGLDGAVRRGNALPYFSPAQGAWHEGQHAHTPALTNTARKPDLPPCLARRRQRPRAQAAQGLPPSRCGTPTAPRPPTRHGSTSARFDVAATQAKPRRGKEKGVVVLTRGRRCSRGRPAGVVASVFR
jgi:hypothetical protein